MTCREALDFLMGYLDGELPPEVRAEFDRHLAICPSCVAYLQNYQETIRVGKSAYQQTEPQESTVPEELVKAMLAALQRP